MAPEVSWTRGNSSRQGSRQRIARAARRTTRPFPDRADGFEDCARPPEYSLAPRTASWSRRGARGPLLPALGLRGGVGDDLTGAVDLDSALLFGHLISHHDGQIRQEHSASSGQQQPPPGGHEAQPDTHQTDTHRDGVLHHPPTTFTLRRLLERRDGVNGAH